MKTICRELIESMRCVFNDMNPAGRFIIGPPLLIVTTLMIVSIILIGCPVLILLDGWSRCAETIKRIVRHYKRGHLKA